MQVLWDQACAEDTACSNRVANPFVPAPPAEPADEDAADPPEARVVTIEDVARFVPATAVLHGEPDGWAVVGVPANFWTRVVPVVVGGELLGDAAQVRFTPRLYRWQYGDGTTRTTTSPGASWEDLGQEELTATATSHRFEDTGRAEASVAVIWSAEYRIADGPWVGVAGAVTSTTPPAPVLVVHERTVLTAG